MAGQVSMTIDSLSVLIPLVRAGRLRALGVTTRQRLAGLPAVPAIAETMPGFEVTVTNGLMVRSGTPKAIVHRLSQAVVRIMASRGAALRPHRHAAGRQHAGRAGRRAGGGTPNLARRDRPRRHPAGMKGRTTWPRRR
ncbi:tripartite tricarboxylate transporter substrate-binding protein [Dankookia sp. P2]|uniref:tripartite tricarboxylate transporter substrate-binding protein n=1 Tax=Dankookia sp. P2 TaxID=3423955 RepID=UPI003D67BBE3